MIQIRDLIEVRKPPLDGAPNSRLLGCILNPILERIQDHDLHALNNIALASRSPQNFYHLINVFLLRNYDLNFGREIVWHAKSEGEIVNRARRQSVPVIDVGHGIREFWSQVIKRAQ